MKAYSKGRVVRVVIPDVVGPIKDVTANGEDFGYVVGFVDAQGVAQERFFPAHMVELHEPLKEAASFSLSGSKAEVLAEVDRLEGEGFNAMVADSVRYAVAALPGTHVSLGGTFGATTTINGSAWTEEKK